MVFSSNPDIQQLQKVVAAIDECQLQDSGSTQSAEHRHEDSSLDRHDEIVHKNLIMQLAALFLILRVRCKLWCKAKK